MKQIISMDDITRIKGIYKDGQENGETKTDNQFASRWGKDRYNTNLVSSETFFCDLRNKELVDIIKKYIQFNEDTEYLSSIHYIHYKVGEEAKEHIDTFTSNRTYIMMLSDSFKGGEFYLGKKHIPMGLGEIIEFNANIPHSVKPIIEGDREVLVIWINKIPKHNKSVI